jgi:hypothetical protein
MIYCDKEKDFQFLSTIGEKYFFFSAQSKLSLGTSLLKPEMEVAAKKFFPPFY